MTSGLTQLDLSARARLEMVANGFAPNFEPAVIKEAGSLTPHVDTTLKDLRSLLWSSIDNPDSKDLDQIEFVEQLTDGNIRLMVGISDVDSYVPKYSAIDQHAFKNTTSIYTGIVTFPMLPERLSYDLTSLLPDVDRKVIVIDMVIDNDGNVIDSSIYPAIARNYAKLNYEMIGSWLESYKNGTSPTPKAVASVPGLTEQILLQNTVKERIRDQRSRRGSLVLKTLEATPITANGEVIDLVLVESNPARDLIENFMVAVNTTVSHFLESKGVASIRRIVKTPERWSRIVELVATYDESLPAEPDARSLREFLVQQKEKDPLHFPDLSLAIVKLLGRGEYTVAIPGQRDMGHFALAVQDYTHSTAPNRRYPDLVTQRLLKAVLDGKPMPYTLDELDEIALHCTEREHAANQVERTMRKVAAAVLLSKHIGEIFDGIVTGRKDNATYVRLIKPPAEGMIVQGQKGLDVGDRVRVRLIATDPDQAFIDFARVKPRRR